MKKLTVLLLVVPLFTFAQDTTFIRNDTVITENRNGTWVHHLPDSAKLTASKVYEDIKAGISGLAAGLKVGAEHVYIVLVRQQLVYSISNLVVIILLIIIACSYYRYLRKVFKKPELDEEHIPVIITGATAIIGLTIYSLITMSETITGFVNPEYGAIKDIFNFVRG